MYLVIGGSGVLGRRVARRLLGRGESVRIVSREPARVADLAELGAVVMQGDLLDDGWQRPALEGVHSLILSCHGLVPPSRTNHPEAVDLAGCGRMIDEATRAGIDHLVYVSAAGAAEDSPVLFYRVKARTERKLRESGLHHTIVRPTVFAETHALILMAEPVRRGDRVMFFGSGRPEVNWVSAEDVADFIVRTLDEPELQGTSHTVGGPDTMSRRQALEVIEQRFVREARTREVPATLLRLMRAVAGPLNPGMKYLLDMALAPELGLDPAPQEDTLGWVGPTALESVVERWMQQGQA